MNARYTRWTVPPLRGFTAHAPGVDTRKYAFMQNFNLGKLAAMTAVLVVLGLAAYSDDDHGAMVLMAGGFVYTIILFMSLYEPPSSGKLAAAFLILGISNLFVFYASAIVMFAPKEITAHLFYVFPSLFGAGITLLVLNKLWKIKLTQVDVLVVLTCILVASLISPFILDRLKESREFKGLVFSLNSILWWIAFTTSIIIRKRRVNQSLQQMAAG
jgi:uncharacterized membrane protein YwzB